MIFSDFRVGQAVEAAADPNELALLHESGKVNSGDAPFLEVAGTKDAHSASDLENFSASRFNVFQNQVILP